MPTLSRNLHGPGSGFPYCDMTTPSIGLPRSEDALSSSLGLSSGKYKRYPEYDYLILCRIRDKSKIYQIMYGCSNCLFNLFHSHQLIYIFFQLPYVDKEKIKNIRFIYNQKHF